MNMRGSTSNRRHGDTIRLGVVLVAYKSNKVLPGCLASLATALHEAGLAQPKSVTVVLVNNDPGQAVNLPDEPVWEQIVINSDTNVGFSPAVNSALASIKDTDYMLLLNPDTRLAPNALSVMIDVALERHAALVGPLLTDEDGRPYGASERPFHSIPREMGRQLLGLTRFRHHYGRRALRDGTARCLTGACLLVEREFLDSVGGLDTTLCMYLEDVVLCWQAHAARQPVVLACEAKCQHALGGSTGGINFDSSIALYLMILGARVEFLRRRRGAFGVYAMRLLFVLGACLRCVRGDAQYRHRQQTVIWWALASGKLPEWQDGPYIELPAFIARAGTDRISDRCRL
jgi:N-acetylglucosaminyl-diphospho-decaprenol L-rhamnosyltransferase